MLCPLQLSIEPPMTYFLSSLFSQAEVITPALYRAHAGIDPSRKYLALTIEPRFRNCVISFRTLCLATDDLIIEWIDIPDISGIPVFV